MRTLIIGASGQLGSDLMRAFAGDEPVGVDHAMVDIEAPSAIAKLLVHHRPELVINTAAFHNVELCELRPDRAMAVNALAVDLLAAQCAAAGAAFAQISTDFVFDGVARQPYTEDDAPNPLSAYGISKYAGERLLRRHSERFFIFRTSGLYGVRGSSTKGYTFIDRILTQAAEGRPLRIVDDVTCSPSYTRDVAASVREIVGHERYGTYHVTNSGACSWYEFAREILSQARLTTELTRTTASAFPSLAERPPYSVLANERSRALGISATPSWQEAIGADLVERSAKSGPAVTLR
jgi:dTDP-4-dehydrorhamnose reductase